MNTGGQRTGRKELCQMVRILVLTILCSLSLPVGALALSADVEVDTRNATYVFNNVDFEKDIQYAAENDKSLLTLGKASVKGNVITFTADGYNSWGGKSSTTSFKIINNSTRADIYITYDFTNTGGGTKPSTGKATISKSGGSISFTVESGKGENNVKTGTITITNLEYGPADAWVKFPAAENGTYTVVYDKGGDSETPISVPYNKTTMRTSAKSYTLTATPADGYKLLGWWSEAKGWLMDNDSNVNDIVFSSVDDDVVRPVFGKEGVAMYCATGTLDSPSQFYIYFDQAVSAAQNMTDKTVLVCSGGTILHSTGSTSFTLPSDISFLIPYGQKNLTPNGDADNHPYALTEYVAAGANIPAINDNVRYELVLPENNTLTVNGKLLVGGAIAGYNGISGATYASSAYQHANLKLEQNSRLIVSGSSAVLSVCGYVYGEGTVYAQNSGTVYEPFVFLDFYGGGYTLGTGGKGATVKSELILRPNPPGNAPITSDETAIFPFTYWTMMNVQTEMTVNGTGKLKGYIDLYAFDAHNRVTISVIDGTGGLLSVNNKTVVSCTYDPSKFVSTLNGGANNNLKKVGRTHLEVKNGASLGTMSMSLVIQAEKLGVVVTISAAFSTEKMAFNIPYNMDIVLTQGAYTIDKKMNLLPGATLKVEDDATLTIGSSGKLSVLTSVFDQKKYSSASTTAVINVENISTFSPSGMGYPTCQDLHTAGLSSTADFVVNGTLKVQGKLGGVVQTDGVTGTLDLTSAAQDNLTIQTQIGGFGNGQLVADAVIARQTFYFHTAGASVHTLKAQVYNPVTGKLVDLTAGQTYKAIPETGLSYEIPDYTYAAYLNSGTLAAAEAKLSEVFSGKNLHLTTQGGWYQYKVDYVRGDNTVTHYVIGSTDSISYDPKFAEIPEVTTNVSGVTATASGTLDGVSVSNITQDVIVTITDKVAWLMTGGQKAGSYTTIQGAVNAYQALPDKSASYVKMIIGSSSTKTLSTSGDTYLDVNGQTVVLTLSGSGTVYGMDSSVTDYTGTPAGKLTYTGGTVSTITENSPTGEYYVAIPNKDKSVSFHRFNISVTGYRFELAAPECALFFIGKFQGDDAAKKYLTSLGFTLKDGKDTPLGTDSYSLPENPENIPEESNPGESPVVRDADGAYLFEVYLMRSFEKDKPATAYTEEITAIAQAMFKNNGTQDSEPQKLSFQKAWEDALKGSGMDEKDKAILRNFLNKFGIKIQAE